MRSTMLFAVAALLITAANARGVDPAGSELWEDLSGAYLGEDAKVTFNDSIRLMMADRVESAHEVPIMVKVPHDLRDMQELVLLVDRNPIQQVARITPHRRLESVGMNIRLEESTPVRAAILDPSGIWHVATKSVLVMSAGGCSSPPPDGAVVAAVGDVNIKQFERHGGASRLKVRIHHPMDTGFVVMEDGDVVPPYYVEKVRIEDERGVIADMLTWAAMSRDPVITIDLPTEGQSVRVSGNDSEGLSFEGLENAPLM